MIIPIDEIKRTLRINWKPRHWAHIVVAITAGFLVAYSILAPIIIVAIYCIYQITQMWSRKIRELKVDGHKDIAEFAYFFIPTYVVCLILGSIIRHISREMLFIVWQVMERL